MLSPFIAASLTYFLGIRSKKKEIDIEKEKELNTVLSNLLNVWHYLTRLESINEILSSKSQKSLFPREFLPGLILKTGFLQDECFSQLDKSNELLKKYDPITYYKLSGLGNNLDLIRKDYIMPYFNNPNLDEEIVVIGTQSLLDETLKDIEDNLILISKLINRKTAKKVKQFINDYLKKNTDEFIQELDQKYYELTIQLIPDHIEKPTFDQFKVVAKTQEFQQIQKFQMKIAIEGSLDIALGIISNNPNISIEELLNHIENNTHNNR